MGRLTLLGENAQNETKSSQHLSHIFRGKQLKINHLSSSTYVAPTLLGTNYFELD